MVDGGVGKGSYRYQSITKGFERERVETWREMIPERRDFVGRKNFW